MWIKTGIIIFLSLACLIPFSAQSKDNAGNYLVILDAGHGGADSGVKLSGGGSEKELTLDLAGAVKRKLDQSRRIKTVLTRSEDRELSFEDRVRQAKDARADLFISFHINAGFERNASGYEMYFTGFKSPSGGKNDSAEIIKDMVRTKSLNESVRFAKVLQANLDKVFPRKGRGLREGPLRMEALAVPGLVLELGFSTNVRDRKSMLDPEVKKAVASALDQSVREYFGSL